MVKDLFIPTDVRVSVERTGENPSIPPSLLHEGRLHYVACFERCGRRMMLPLSSAEYYTRPPDERDVWTVLISNLRFEYGVRQQALLEGRAYGDVLTECGNPFLPEELDALIFWRNKMLSDAEAFFSQGEIACMMARV